MAKQRKVETKKDTQKVNIEVILAEYFKKE